MTTATLQDTFEALQCCVIIPTYNNAKTLRRVVDGVLHYTNNIIVVNDGATDETAKILEDYPQIITLKIETNKGKGNALKTGFRFAIFEDYKYAITIDSDGQHFPKDLPLFIKALQAEESKEILLIGSRNMTQSGVPKGSSFGNKFSNFWFWFVTGRKLEDTQSGYRLYPLEVVKNLKLFTTKFEYEIEIIVKSSWRDVTVKNIPINVLYDERERVTHFRPYRDFARISLLNTWLVLVALFVIKPRDVIRKFKKKGFRRFLKEDVLSSDDSPKKKALSMALGVFLGFSPFWGFHNVLAISLPIVFKLNKAISFAFSQISFLPFIPFILYASNETGNLVLGRESSYNLEEIEHNFNIMEHLETYIVGSLVLSTVSAIVIGFLGYTLLILFQKTTTTVTDG